VALRKTNVIGILGRVLLLLLMMRTDMLICRIGPGQMPVRGMKLLAKDPQMEAILKY